MSLILDALRKADHDRKIEDDAGSLDDIYHHESKPEIEKNGLIIGLVIFALVLLFGILAFFIFGNTEESPKNKNTTNQGAFTNPEKPTLTSEAPQTGSSTQDSPTNTSSTATSSSNAVDERPASVATENISNKNIDLSSLRKTQIEQQYRSQNRDKTRAQDDIIALYKAENPEPIEPVASKKIQAESTVTQRESAVEIDEQSLAAFRLTPSIKELLPSQQRDIPTMMYTDHQYVEGGRSSVTIGGKRLYEGNAPSQGLIVQRILKDGIIVKYNQIEFKMAAMNSWLNF